MFCASCGAELTAGSAFCHSCGTRIAQVAEPSAFRPQEGRPRGIGRSGAGPGPGAYQPAPPPAARTGLTTAGVWSIICSVLALVLIPPLLGGIAIYLGFRAKKRGDAAGDLLIVVGVVALIAGRVIDTILWTQAR